MGIELIVIVAAGFVTVVTAIGLLYKMVRALIRFFRKAHEAFERLMNMDARVANVEEATRQLTPNGGSHMRDDITETRTLIEEHVRESKGLWGSWIAERGDIWKAIAAKDVIDTATGTLAVPYVRKDDPGYVSPERRSKPRSPSDPLA